MNDSAPHMSQLLAEALCANTSTQTDDSVEGLQRLSGGANMETWRFNWLLDSSSSAPLILRRLPISASESAAQDLGYICGNVWRFGRYQKPVGGFGDYQQLLDGYCSVTGSAPSLEDIHYWEVYTALGWGIVCLTMIEMYRSGQDQSLERAAVGRRMSESEIDLLLLLDEEPG